MSANPTPTIQGTQAPSPVELLWERYKSLAYVVILGAIGALGVNYAIKYFAQKEVDQTWSTFAVNLGLDASYTDQTKASESLTERLVSLEADKLKAALATATDQQKPYVLMALARKAALEKDWAAAEGHLNALETGYPNHSLVKSSPHPVQSQDVVKDMSMQPKPQPPARPKKDEYKPVQPGSVVSLMRAEIASAKAYQAPGQFEKKAIPADATKVKFELSGDYGSFTIALLTETPLHAEAFKKLAEAKFWEGIAVDEIRRPGKFNKQPHELHLGFESTKADDRAQWKDTEPSKNPLEFEKNQLSHFAGAVSARNEADGKSCADRFWIAVDDAPRYDGERVIFGFVVEGLENLKKVCEATMTATEEEQGRGKPSETIRVTSVTVLQ